MFDEMGATRDDAEYAVASKLTAVVKAARAAKVAHTTRPSSDGRVVCVATSTF